MANNRIQIKRTNVPGRVPNTTNSSNSMYIAPGEFALNMYDKQLYTSNGSTLITIGSAGTSLQLSESLKIGDISSQLMSINASSIFTGNVDTNTTVNTTSISVQNATSISNITPTTIYVGNSVANIAIDVTGGIKSISIASANINSTGVATIQTAVNHGINLITQAKLYVNTSQISLNTANYSSDYNPAGFTILSIPTANTIRVNVPTSDYKYKWGDRTINYINRNQYGVVTVVTKGPHGYQNLDKAYATNVKYDPNKKAPFTLLDSLLLPVPNTLTVVDDFTVTYPQNQYSSVNRSLVGYTASLYGQDINTTYAKQFLTIRAPNSVFQGFAIGDPITLGGLLYSPYSRLEFYSDLYGVNRISPSNFNGLQQIVDISTPNSTESIITIYLYTEGRPRHINVFSTTGTQTTTISQGYIAINYLDTGVLTNNSQLCPFLENVSISGTINATNPTGITIKNNEKLIYVLDNSVFVGNSTVGNIIDIMGSRVFKPSVIETFVPPTFVIQASAQSVNEGGVITYYITTANFGTGTLYWTNSGTVTGSDFTDGTNSGTISIFSDYGTISKTLVNDFTAEGEENIVFELRTNSTSGPIVGTAVTVVVNDTSKQTYSINANWSARDEGQTVIFTVTTQGVPNGTTLYYNNIGTTNADDFDDGLNAGSFNINNNTGTITKTLRNDITKENQENIKLEIRTGSISGPVQVTSGFVSIFDTSVPTYSVTPDISPVNEGVTITFNVTTAGVPNGTTLYWTNSGNTSGADFIDGTNSGNFVIQNNAGSIPKTLLYDLLTEGPQTIVLQVRTDSTSGDVMAYSSTVTVNDTSTSASTYYSITPSVTTLTEGNSVTFNIYAEVSNGTTLYWTNGGTTGAADFADGLNSGTVVINNQTGTVTRAVAVDAITEGTETIVFMLRTNSTTGTIVAVSTVTVTGG